MLIDNPVLIKDIFTDEQRKKLIEDSKPLLLDGKKVNQFFQWSDYYQEDFNWYKATHATIHLHPDFIWAFDIIISRLKDVVGMEFEVDASWMNLSNGDRDRRKVLEKNGGKWWHNHKKGPVSRGCDYACVYYMKIPFPFFSNGTLFKDYGLVKAKQNSMLLFPSHLDHATPSSPLRFKRQTWAINLNRR